MENVGIWKVASKKTFIDLRNGFRARFFLPSSDEAELYSVLGEPKFTKKKWKETESWKKENFLQLCVAQERHIMKQTQV